MKSTSPLLELMPDGTVKQRHPFTGTRVWTMPGRGRRPLPRSADEVVPLEPGATGLAGCAFCPGHHLQNPPEKARLVAEGERWRPLVGLGAGELETTVDDFRRVPNLFEICSVDYWRTNHGVQVPPAARERAERYLADPAGRAHLQTVLAMKERIGGDPGEITDERLLDAALNWCASTHELVIPRRHHVDGATMSDQLASSGELTWAEHRAYIGMTIDAMADLYATSPSVQYVSVFQNWLKPAGASFEHLHKQVVAIDEVGEHVTAAVAALEANPDAFNEQLLDVAVDNSLVVAANQYAVAHAGFGHRYPSIEIHSLSPRREPWLMSPEEVAGMADLLHAVHAAGGASLSCNEEWHHRPPGMDQAMPWRIVVKWRISTLAGFEGDTKIYLNTLSPWDVRTRVVAQMRERREQGRLAPGITIGDECAVGTGMLPH